METMMTKEVTAKVRKYIKLTQEADALMKEIKLHMEKIDEDACYMYDPFFTDEPCGEDQGYGEYCDQSCYGNGCYGGAYYYPVEGRKKQWVGWHYSM